MKDDCGIMNNNVTKKDRFLIFMTGILGSAVFFVYWALPFPYNLISDTAIFGPLSICLYGLWLRSKHERQ